MALLVWWINTVRPGNFLKPSHSMLNPPPIHRLAMLARYVSQHWRSKRRPLTGGLSQIADAAGGFSKGYAVASQKFGGVEPHSVLDLAALLAAVKNGNIPLALGAVGRPLGRSLSLSPWYQAAIAGKSAPLGFASLLSRSHITRHEQHHPRTAAMTGIDSWSITPASNSTADGGSINWAEGQPPSSVNNSARQMLADERARQNDLIWFQYGTGDQGAGNLAVPGVYATGTSFTIAGANVTAVYHAGRRVRAVGSSTGTIYGTITSSSFQHKHTTVNVTWDSGSLSNETLTISLEPDSRDRKSCCYASRSNHSRQQMRVALA